MSQVAPKMGRRAATRGPHLHTARTTITTASFVLTALLAILALWQTFDAEACATSDLELAHCQAAVDGG
jgi:hypothetical protein